MIVKRTSLLLFFGWFWFPPLLHAAPQRPKIPAVAYVRIFASNLVNSRKFYAEILRPGDALPTLLSPDGWQVDPAAWRESLPRPQVELIQVPSPAPASLLDEVVFLTNNTGALRTYLISKGVSVRSSRKSPKYFQVVDPEGHHIGFIEGRKSLSSTQAPHSAWPIIHAGFVVRDRVATEHFYKDILGFLPYWYGGMKDDQTDWVSMQVPDGTDWLEFMVNVSPDADQRLRGIMNHIAIGVTDIHATEQRLRDTGLKLTEEPHIGRGGKWQLNVYDPDGTRVEFMEFKPVQKPCCSEYTGPHPGPQL
jgi:catechol 2,3-dioxygenase-like lactoylglutathione lyase family enzyme